MAQRQFGHIAGVEVGTHFARRADLSSAGVHRPSQAGIAGGQSEGAESIVVSEGYEDDKDYGDEIIYTGHGGRNPVSKAQISDQELKKGNMALAKSATLGLPVRVVRGPNSDNPHAPDTGYRYEGLFRVEDHWSGIGVSGFVVWLFRMVALEPPAAAGDSETPPDQQPSLRVPQTTLRIIRNTALSREVKELHDYACQVCGERLQGAAGPYAEAAHIRPLGTPHDGPDSLDNLLCLCPNHHVLFDLGAFTIADDLHLVGLAGSLRAARGHSVNIQHVRYRRGHYQRQVVDQSSASK